MNVLRKGKKRRVVDDHILLPSTIVMHPEAPPNPSSKPFPVLHRFSEFVHDNLEGLTTVIKLTRQLLQNRELVN